MNGNTIGIYLIVIGGRTYISDLLNPSDGYLIYRFMLTVGIVTLTIDWALYAHVRRYAPKVPQLWVALAFRYVIFLSNELAELDRRPDWNNGAMCQDYALDQTT